MIFFYRLWVGLFLGCLREYLLQGILELCTLQDEDGSLSNCSIVKDYPKSILQSSLLTVV